MVGGRRPRPTFRWIRAPRLRSSLVGRRFGVCRPISSTIIFSHPVSPAETCQHPAHRAGRGPGVTHCRGAQAYAADSRAADRGLSRLTIEEPNAPPLAGMKVFDRPRRHAGGLLPVAAGADTDSCAATCRPGSRAVPISRNPRRIGVVVAALFATSLVLVAAKPRRPSATSCPATSRWSIGPGRSSSAGCSPPHQDPLVWPCRQRTSPVTVEEVLKGAVADSTIVVSATRRCSLGWLGAARPGTADAAGGRTRAPVPGRAGLRRGRRVGVLPRCRVRLGHLPRGPGGGRRLAGAGTVAPQRHHRDRNRRGRRDRGGPTGTAIGSAAGSASGRQARGAPRTTSCPSARSCAARRRPASRTGSCVRERIASTRTGRCAGSSSSAERA